jgi:hypothetical protein
MPYYLQGLDSTNESSDNNTTNQQRLANDDEASSSALSSSSHQHNTVLDSTLSHAARVYDQEQHHSLSSSNQIEYFDNEHNVTSDQVENEDEQMLKHLATPGKSPVRLPALKFHF